MTHRQILAAVWGPAHAEDTQYLRVFVGQLRGKIETAPESPRLIVTEPGIGYRLWTPEPGDDQRAILLVIKLCLSRPRSNRRG